MPANRGIQGDSTLSPAHAVAISKSCLHGEITLAMASFRSGQQHEHDWPFQRNGEDKPGTCRQPSGSPGAMGGPERHNVHKEI